MAPKAAKGRAASVARPPAKKGRKGTTNPNKNSGGNSPLAASAAEVDVLSASQIAERTREAAFERMITAANEQSAARRARIVNEADLQLTQAKQQAMEKEERAMAKLVAQHERLNQRLRLAGALPAGGGVAEGESPEGQSLTMEPESRRGSLHDGHRPANLALSLAVTSVVSDEHLGSSLAGSLKGSSRGNSPLMPMAAGGGIGTQKNSWTESFNRKRAMNRMTEAVAAAAASMATSTTSSAQISPRGGGNGTTRLPPIQNLTIGMYGVGGSGFDSAAFLAAAKIKAQQERQQQQMRLHREQQSLVQQGSLNWFTGPSNFVVGQPSSPLGGGQRTAIGNSNGPSGRRRSSVTRIIAPDDDPQHPYGALSSDLPARLSVDSTSGGGGADADGRCALGIGGECAPSTAVMEDSLSITTGPQEIVVEGGGGNPFGSDDATTPTAQQATGFHPKSPTGSVIGEDEMPLSSVQTPTTMALQHPPKSALASGQRPPTPNGRNVTIMGRKAQGNITDTNSGGVGTTTRQPSAASRESPSPRTTPPAQSLQGTVTSHTATMATAARVSPASLALQGFSPLPMSALRAAGRRAHNATMGPPSDIKSNVPPHEPVVVTTVGCATHDYAPYVAYCHTCDTPICSMCVDLEHSNTNATVGGAIHHHQNHVAVAAHLPKGATEGGKHNNAGASATTNTNSNGANSPSPSASLGGPLLSGLRQQQPQVIRHVIEPLADFINGIVANIAIVQENNLKISGQLESLEAQHPSLLEQLHSYIDDEVDGLVQTLEHKRSSLHTEVNTMKGSLLQLLSDELATCETALGQLEEGRHVLELLTSGAGTSQTRMGELLHGTLRYDDFLREADPILSVPPRVTEQLQLQLPIQGLQDVCDMVSWTEASRNAAPQMFPM